MDSVKMPATSVCGVGLLVALHVAFCVMPSLSSWLCLIPGLTFSGMVWNLLTSAFLERSPVGLVVSSAACALFGYIFEPRWGRREVVRFVLVCAVMSALGSCAIIMAVYVATRSESLLFVELSGFSGVVAGIAVAIHQAAHSDRCISTGAPVGWLVGESRKVAMLYLLVHAAWCLLTGHTVDILLAVHGLFFAWIYLRFYQPHASALDASAAFGDASEAFAFASMFFSALQPAVDSLSRATWRLVQAIVPPSLAQQAGGVLEPAFPRPGGATDYLPGSNPTLAEERRARAARSLEERLAAAPARKAAEPQAQPAEAAV